MEFKVSTPFSFLFWRCAGCCHILKRTLLNICLWFTDIKYLLSVNAHKNQNASLNVKTSHLHEHTSAMTMSWHFLMNLFSALTIVCRNLRYWTCRPWDSVQWTKCCTTRSLISLHSWKLFMKMCCMVTASRICKTFKKLFSTVTLPVGRKWKFGLGC